ncbi:MAG TPA: hypothetical protein VK619_07475 [Pyrinomonadaceae bacterium]|nr:hypothetical protein [Pyrinomonadaceae bacterium]
MKKRALISGSLFACLLAAVCIYPVVYHAQTQAGANAEDELLRHVSGNTLTSDAQPRIRIKVSRKYRYVGGQSFILYNVARAEQHYFVEADSQHRIKRLLLFQFEGYLPSNTHTYNYSMTRSVTIGGQQFLTDTSFGNVAAFRQQYPDSDAARGAAFLESKGYHLPGEIAFQRFVRMVDESHRSELLAVFYEDLNQFGASEAQVTGDGVNAARRDEITRKLEEHALKSFEILR